jgi:predicted dehydrogenase
MCGEEDVLSKDRIRVGIWGAGGIALKLHLPELSGIENVDIACLCGRTERRLKLLCEQFGVPSWTKDPDALLSDPDLDAIVVALPHPLHVSAGLDVMAAGKHLMMQKPLCTSLGEAERFVAGAAESKRIVFCLPHLQSPGYLTAAKLVASGRLGHISGGHCRVSHGGPEVYYRQIQDGFGEQDTGDLWFFDRDRAEVGALFDMGVYAVSRLIGLMGSVHAVTGRVATVAKPTDLEDSATLILEFTSGALGTVETGWCDGAGTSAISIHGTRGKLELPGRGDAALTLLEQASERNEDLPPVRQDFACADEPGITAHESWIGAIETGNVPPMNLAESALHVTEVLLAGLESSRKEGRIRIRSSLSWRP